MARGTASRASVRDVPAFNAPAWLEASGLAKPPVAYGRGETIFTQGDRSAEVLFIHTGGVTLSVRSKRGHDAVLATLGPGDFFGEACLAGQPVRMSSASAITPSVIGRLSKATMLRLLHRQRAMADGFIAHVLSRFIRIEEDLLDQLFNSSEKRLARTLLRLARYGTEGEPTRTVPAISQDTLAEMIGAPRARVHFILNKFKTRGFIGYDGARRLTINRSLLSVVLHD